MEGTRALAWGVAVYAAGFLSVLNLHAKRAPEIDPVARLRREREQLSGKFHLPLSCSPSLP